MTRLARRLTSISAKNRQRALLVTTARVRPSLADAGGEGRFRAGADSDVVGQVHPTNLAGGVDQEFRGSRDVFAFRAAFGMQHSVLTNGFSRRIGENWEGIAAGLAELLRFGGRIDGD